mmetsp:Transcript_55184/g.154908  ORF Transcript_55184/g.154908 Transcript_55184/m.154908 type:complete len:133 (+) Transcript_55184:147-545(+)
MGRLSILGPCRLRVPAPKEDTAVHVARFREPEPTGGEELPGSSAEARGAIKALLQEAPQPAAGRQRAQRRATSSLRKRASRRRLRSLGGGASATETKSAPSEHRVLEDMGSDASLEMSNLLTPKSFMSRPTS